MAELSYVYDVINIDLSTLAAFDAISAESKIDAAREMGFRIIESEIYIDVYDKPVNTGGIMVGIAVDLSAAEIELTIENDTQSNAPGNAVGEARVKRPVWPLGIVSHDATFGTIVWSKAAGGVNWKPSPKGWSIPEGSFLTYWAYCLDTTLTGATQVTIFAKHKGVWLRD